MTFLTLLGAVIAACIFGIGIFLALIWRKVVPTNQVHIVQYRKKTIIHGVGHDGGNVYYKIPASIPRFGITVTEYPLSVFAISLTNYSAYDIGRLPFVVDVTAFFRIEKPNMAAERVANFNELNGQLTEVLEGTVRRVLATNKLEEIMEDRAKLGEEFTNEVVAQLGEWGVTTVKMIEFMDIRDTDSSSVISDIMAKEQSRISRESRETVAGNNQVAETKEIEANRAVEMSRIEAEATVGKREAEKNQSVGIAKEKSNQEVQTEAKVTTERTMAVRLVEGVRQAEIDRDVAVVRAEQDQKVQVVDAQAMKESQIIRAEAERESTIQIAEGAKQSTLKEAEGVLALGSARADAEKQMLLAPVNAQITLATEIGSNEGYQQYLIEVRRVEATEVVGKEMATAMSKADLKVIANSGNVQNGMGGLADVFTSAGGTSIAGMLEGLAQSDKGKALVDKLIGSTTQPEKKENTQGSPIRKPSVVDDAVSATRKIGK